MPLLSIVKSAASSTPALQGALRLEIQTHDQSSFASPNLNHSLQGRNKFNCEQIAGVGSADEGDVPPSAREPPANRAIGDAANLPE
jgi:hypothetical protein